MAGNSAYRNGKFVNTIPTEQADYSKSLFIGARNNNDTTIDNYISANILSVAIYQINLNASQIYTAYYQMMYCHVNPDWSVWGRRRRWFYAPEVATTEYTQGVAGAGTPVGAVVKQTGKRVGAF